MITYKDGFTAEKIPQKVWENMQGKTYHENSIIGRDDLAYLKVKYYNFNHEIHTGELIVDKKLGEEVLEIFYKLYENEYEIEKINLCDVYEGDDNKSMADNNCSAFNYRTVDSTDVISMHGRGRAIDINPLINPYIVGEKVMPPAGMQYSDRKLAFKHKIDHDDLCYKVFSSYGWQWGGDWKNTKDYQHFYKPQNGVLRGILRKIKRKFAR